MVSRGHARRGSALLGCLGWLILIGSVVYLGVHVGAPYYRYYRYRDAIAQQLRFAVLRNDAVILHNIYAAADSIGLPYDAYDLNVTRTSNRIRITGAYDDVWEIPHYIRLVHFWIDQTAGI